MNFDLVNLQNKLDNAQRIKEFAVIEKGIEFDIAILGEQVKFYKKLYYIYDDIRLDLINTSVNLLDKKSN